jgi:hypothetical protein
VFKRELRPGDRILAMIPTNGPLDYHLDRLGVDRRHLTRDERASPRVFAVVDLGEGQTLGRVVANSIVRDTSVWLPPVTVATLAESAIFVYQRKHAAASP